MKKEIFFYFALFILCANPASASWVNFDLSDFLPSFDSLDFSLCNVDSDCGGANECQINKCMNDISGRRCYMINAMPGSVCNSGSGICSGDGNCVSSLPAIEIPDPNVPLECSDSNPCTIDYWDDAESKCTSDLAPDASSCGVGYTCQSGICTPLQATILQPLTIPNPVACFDNNPCTADVWIPGTGECAYTNLDGQACGANAACTGGQCVRTVPDNCIAPGICFGPIYCPDNNACTIDTVYGWALASCQMIDMSPPGSSNARPVMNCDDGYEGTIDSCEPALGCIYTLDQNQIPEFSHITAMAGLLVVAGIFAAMRKK